MFQLDPVTLYPIGLIRSPRPAAEDDHWGGVESIIDLDPAWIHPETIAGLGDFSHIEVIYCFHKVNPELVERGARHPRNNPDWPEVGILAQRARRRPNRLGLSRCRLTRIDGLRLTVEDLDAIDGTPVLDIKPWMSETAPRGETRQPEWSSELMVNYY